MSMPPIIEVITDVIISIRTALLPFMFLRAIWLINDAEMLKVLDKKNNGFSTKA